MQNEPYLRHFDKISFAAMGLNPLLQNKFEPYGSAKKLSFRRESPILILSFYKFKKFPGESLHWLMCRLAALAVLWKRNDVTF